MGTERPISEEPRALKNDEGVNRLQAGQRPGQLVPRRKVKPANDFEDVDTKELFPEDCLVHEDCEENEFCSPPPENKCIDACTLDVCEDGFEGNAYDKCTKVKSRVGMK